SLKVRARAREQRLDFSLQELFEKPTVAALAAGLGTVEEAPAASAGPFSLLSSANRSRMPDGVEDAYPLTCLQAGMLFHSDYSAGSTAYHDILSFHLRCPFDAPALAEAVAELVQRHGILRTSFDLASFDEALQLVHRRVDPPLEIADLRGLSPERQEEIL